MLCSERASPLTAILIVADKLYSLSGKIAITTLCLPILLNVSALLLFKDKYSRSLCFLLRKAYVATYSVLIA
jgi:hypothetical protein